MILCWLSLDLFLFSLIIYFFSGLPNLSGVFSYRCAPSSCKYLLWWVRSLTDLCKRWKVKTFYLFFEWVEECVECVNPNCSTVICCECSCAWFFFFLIIFQLWWFHQSMCCTCVIAVEILSGLYRVLNDEHSCDHDLSLFSSNL